MEQDDFYELFYSNLRKELDDEYVNSIKDLVDYNKFNKKNFMALLEEKYDK